MSLQHVATPELEQFERFANTLVLEDRSLFTLLPYQKKCLEDYFNGGRETLILIPKKNGKTTLIAALALYHMLTTEDCLCCIAASSVKQAGILYRQAEGFINRTPGFRKHFLIRGGSREIRSKNDKGLIQVLAADADTADGVIPTLAIVDELHRHKSVDLYTVFRDGLGPRHGRMITISTAGDDETSPLGKVREMAHSLPGEHDGKYHYYRSPDGEFVMHEWALDIADDRHDMNVVKMANPAPWHTTNELRIRHDSPSTNEWDWARFACNVWYPWGEGSAIRAEDWDECYSNAAILDPNVNTIIGVDLGWKRKSDMTAIVPLQWTAYDLITVGEPVLLEPAGDDSLLDDRAIVTALLVFAGQENFDREAFIRELSHDNRLDAVTSWADNLEKVSAYPLSGIVFDPTTGGHQLAQTLERDYRLPFIRFEQRVTALARADQQFLEAIRRRSIRHKWNTEARAHALNAVEVPTGGKMYFGRAKSGARKPTDALRAASMAHSVLLESDGRPKADKHLRKDSYAFM